MSLSKEELYKLVFELSPEAIVVLDIKGDLVMANGRLMDWLGYAPEEVVGMNLATFPFVSLKGKAIILKNFMLRMAGQKVEPYEIEFISRDGQSKFGRIVAQRFHNSKGEAEGEVVVITDVTEKRKLEEEQRQRIEEIEKMNRAMIGRELKMVELKNELDRLKQK